MILALKDWIVETLITGADMGGPDMGVSPVPAPGSASHRPMMLLAPGPGLATIRCRPHGLQSRTARPARTRAPRPAAAAVKTLICSSEHLKQMLQSSESLQHQVTVGSGLGLLPL